MFVGHLALALVAKRVEPGTNLAWYVAGVSALDLVWPIFVLTGLETVRIVPGATAFTPLVFESYPWSHSVVMAFLWALVLVGIARLAHVSWRAFTLLAALVLSHWVLDFITHAPDLPLWPGNSPLFGLALWNSIPGTFAVEGAMWLIGIVAYVRLLSITKQRPGWPFWSFVVVSTILWASGPFSAPPPTESALGWFGLVGWISVPWAAWADWARHGGRVVATS